MSIKSKGQEFFEGLTAAEKVTIIEIIKLENASERLDVKESVIAVRKIKQIIAKNSMEWSD
ncbi:MAG: hypothetical protein ACRCZI_10815 [Cetobacterium sp.]